MEYTSFINGERPAGGMYTLPPEMANVPPNWLAYFAVEDCDATVAKATSLGAQTLSPAMDIPTVGRFAVLLDPQGAAFGVIKLANQPA
jgi:predicted enzyme related to lactoylglutathione lyase